MEWFEAKIKYWDKDKDDKVVESFLFDAVSWTDSENQITKEMKKLTEEVFVVDSIKRSKITEIFAYDSGGLWFSAVLEMMTLNEDKGREELTKVYCLIMADDIEQALFRIKESMSCSVVTYLIYSLSISNIVDVIPNMDDQIIEYDEEEPII